jgi:cytochrome c oxidase cbb3-type subunit 3
MFKFIKKYAETMDNISFYPLISLMIFFIFFLALLIYVKKMDKKSVQILANIPLDVNEEQLTQPI